MKHITYYFTVLLFIGAFQTYSQTPDNRIENQLNRMNLQYEVTSSGNFKLLFELENNRTQIVFINSETKYYEDAEVREISSPAKFIVKADELTHEQLWTILTSNYQSTLGAWQLEPAANGWGLHFAVKVPALMPENRLMMYMVLVAKVADDMEKIFSAEDIF